MSNAAKADAIGVLDKAMGDLRALADSTEAEIGSVARVFAALTGSTDEILNLAGAIVACVESESVNSILPRVRTLGAAAQRLIGKRLEVTRGVLETVTAQVQLLRKLSATAGGQSAIALKTRALSFLTNIEVARLGDAGLDLQYLSDQLADFSRSLTGDTRDLAGQTDGRRAAVEEASGVLALELPRLRDKLARVETALANDLTALDSNLTELARAPVQFRKYVEDIAVQIAGVVTAVQAHDITRQQLEHVQESLALVGATLRRDGTLGKSAGAEISQSLAGLTIQICQLRTIKETVANWATQIRSCMGGILRISTSEVAGIGAVILGQESDVSSQLAHIEMLEGESHAYGERIHSAVRELSTLMQLVGDHLKRSKSVREHLQLLTFNSIIKARRLGMRAKPILAIAQSIEETSAEWKQITDQSGQSMRQIMTLAEQTNEVMEAFSEASNDSLRAAQTQTRTGLEGLRAAAASASMQAGKMKTTTERMQAKIAEIGKTGELLDSCFGRFDAVLAEIEKAMDLLEVAHPGVREHYDAGEVERLFSAFYTTEVERNVLRAALGGAVLPVAPPALGGNSVELF